MKVTKAVRYQNIFTKLMLAESEVAFPVSNSEIILENREEMLAEVPASKWS